LAMNPRVEFLSEKSMYRQLQSSIIRVLDVSAAVVGLILFSPLLLIIGVAIRKTSAGPAVFAQPRVGRYEREYICYKLRTMYVETRSVGTHEVSRSAITPIGRFLRRTKIDELPQLWNVLRGDMSLVGPRPGLPVQSALIEARRRLGVFAVRPGVTGPAQVKQVDMSEPERLALLDCRFAHDPTVIGYLKYVLMTVVGRGQGDRVRG